MSELTLDPLSRPAENGPVSSVWAGIKSWLQPKHPLDGETMLKYFIYQHASTHKASCTKNSK